MFCSIKSAKRSQHIGMQADLLYLVPCGHHRHLRLYLIHSYVFLARLHTARLKELRAFGAQNISFLDGGVYFRQSNGRRKSVRRWNRFPYCRSWTILFVSRYTEAVDKLLYSGFLTLLTEKKHKNVVRFGANNAITMGIYFHESKGTKKCQGQWGIQALAPLPLT